MRLVLRSTKKKKIPSSKTPGTVLQEFCKILQILKIAGRIRVNLIILRLTLLHSFFTYFIRTSPQVQCQSAFLAAEAVTVSPKLRVGSTGRRNIANLTVVSKILHTQPIDSAASDTQPNSGVR